MTGIVRSLLAALIVVVGAAAASLYIGYRSGAEIARAHRLSYDVASTDVGSVLSGSHGDSKLVDIAVEKLEDVFYKPVDPQQPLRGETNALLAYLRSHKIAHANLPSETVNGDPSQDSQSLAHLLAYTQAHYGQTLGTHSRTELTEAALRGIMNSVDDPYTVYLSPDEIRGLTESLSGGNFGGIGVYILQLKTGEVFVEPIEDLPAARAGMKPGEVVDTVDGSSVRGMPSNQVESLIRGESGTQVHLTTHLYQQKAEHHYTITREIIHVPTVHAKMEGSIDYIRLSDFGETSADEIHKALLDGKTKGATGYILDLRDNGGGFVDAAVKISSDFIPSGVIVSTIDRDGAKQDESALGTSIDGLKPLVILVNKYTASASEITAGALQDYHLATLIGTKTFGKGVVQSIYPMPDQGALKITTARYVTPAGRDIQHRGILPDIIINQDTDPRLIDTPKDKQLAAAKAKIRTLNAPSTNG